MTGRSRIPSMLSRVAWIVNGNWPAGKTVPPSLYPTSRCLPSWSLSGAKKFREPDLNDTSVSSLMSFGLMSGEVNPIE